MICTYIIVLRCNINCHDVVFFQHPRKGLHFGERHPILGDSHGSAGSPERSFPGFGWTSRTDWSRVERLLLMLLVGVLSIGEHNLQLKDPQLNLDENDLAVCGSGVWHSFPSVPRLRPKPIITIHLPARCSRLSRPAKRPPDLLLQARIVRASSCGRRIHLKFTRRRCTAGLPACCRSSVSGCRRQPVALQPGRPCFL